MDDNSLIKIMTRRLAESEVGREIALKKLAAAILHAALLEDAGTYEDRAKAAARIVELEATITELTAQLKAEREARDCIVNQLLERILELT